MPWKDTCSLKTITPSVKGVWVHGAEEKAPTAFDSSRKLVRLVYVEEEFLKEGKVIPLYKGC